MIIFEDIYWNSPIFHYITRSPAGTHLPCEPWSTFTVVAALCISLSNHQLSTGGPERPSVRPVSYEVRSVFITSVKAAAFSPSCLPLWRAAATAVLSNLDIIAVAYSDYAASWLNTERCHLSQHTDLNHAHVKALNSRKRSELFKD